MPTNLWQKGKSANPAGKPKGPNKATIAIREFCRGLLEDPTYQIALRIRLYKGKLAPQVEALMFHYAYGKPRETVKLETAPRPLVLDLVTDPEQLRAIRDALDEPDEDDDDA